MSKQFCCFIDEKFNKEIAKKKTAKSRVEWMKRRNEAIRYINTNRSSMNSALDGFKNLMDAKVMIINKLTKIKTLWKALRTSGTTPESLCFEAIMKKFLGGVIGEDNYFINYSDGAPWFSVGNGRYGSNDVYYAGDRAVDHGRKMVKLMKNNGIKIMSYFVSDGDYVNDSDRNTFSKMYGKDASFIDCTNMMNVAKTMNDKFLSK